MILAFEACACRMNDDRSGVANGGFTDPSTSAAILRDDGRCVSFQRMPERIVVSDEEPAVAAALDDFLRRANRERAGVEHPLHGIRRAELAVEIRGSCGVSDKSFFFSLATFCTARPTADTGTSTIRST